MSSYVVALVETVSVTGCPVTPIRNQRNLNASLSPLTQDKGEGIVLCPFDMAFAFSFFSHLSLSMITQIPSPNRSLNLEERQLPKRHRVTSTQICFWDGVLLAFALATVVGAMRLHQQLNLPAATLPTLVTADRGVQFYDRYDHYICTIHADRDRQPVPLSKISKNMRKAVVAAEDHHFYNHHGIDIYGIVRAFNKNRKAGHVVEGGSTITQQLVRNLYLDKTDRSYKRKIKEVFLSWDAENRYSKAKLLETYLNEVYFGGGVYGIERAANHYFDKHALQLSIPESAFLAGLIKSPSVFGNPANRKLALARQHEVLDKMAEYGYIAQAQTDALKSEKLSFKEGQNQLKYPCYMTYALHVVSKEMGDQMWKQNLQVYTNLDPGAQKAATAVLNKGIKSAPKGVNQGALVSMSVRDGAVLAMVGGVGNYQDNQWNRALFPHTAGSSFKPFVYLTGLIKGVLQPDTLIDDAPLSISSPNSPTWTPKNFDGKFKGWMTVRDALAYSRNICAVRVALETGIPAIVETAHAAGITSQLDPYPSLALGTCAVSPLEMAVAYSTLARNGVYMPPQVIRAIHTADGKTCREFAATASNNLPAEAVSELVDVMQDVVKRGTGTRASLPGIAVAGKTGTADGARDIWFCGFTPDTVTTVWGGSDKNQAIHGNNVTGGSVMASIWRQYMIAYYAEHKPAALAFSSPTTRLATAIPKYDDTALLTIDSTKENVSGNGAKVIALQEQAAPSDEQVSANIPTIVYNSTNAVKEGIAKAFIVQGAGAVKRWQYSQSEHERLERVAQVVAEQSEPQLVPIALELSAPASQQTVAPAAAQTVAPAAAPAMQHNDAEYKVAPDHSVTASLETLTPVMEQDLGNQKVFSILDQSSN